MGLNQEQLKKILKIIIICLATFHIIFAISRFITDIATMRMIQIIWTFYWIVFSVLLILGELGNKTVLTYFQFLGGFCGKGLYVIFLGSLLLSDIDDWKTWVGVVYIIVGIIYVGFNCVREKQDPGLPDGKSSDQSETNSVKQNSNNMQPNQESQGPQF